MLVSRPVLEIQGLHKAYGPIEVLRGVDLRVQAGEVLALLGVNGAGKTTLASIVTGLLRADGGTVRVLGHGLEVDALAARRQIGFASQEVALYPELTVRENLRYFGELRGLRGRSLDAQVGEAAAALQLEAFVDRRVGPLSGGEKRRVHVAIALLGDRPLLLLDEPTAGADVETRSRLLEAVKEKAARGSAVIYSTHYLGEVEELDASLAILDGGRILARGALSELVARYGQTLVEVSFRDPPAAFPARATEVDERRCLVPTEDPAEVFAQLALLQEDRNLRSIEVVRPSLESVFLTIVGRRFSGEPLAARAGGGRA